MRRLGLLLALAACTPGSGNPSSGDSLETTTGDTGTTDPGGIQTVTGETEHQDSGASDPVTTTTGAVASDTSTTDNPTTSDTEDTTTTPPQPAVCGDGFIDGDEICDDGNEDDGDDCTVLCRPPECGDGILHVGEKCDDGNKSDSDECTNACEKARCGDGKLYEDKEECDDNNDVNTDACLTTCKVAQCGDNVIWEGKEVCDDGFNDGEYNGCAPGCKGPSEKRCGDGVVQPEYEHCDTDSKLAGVGCTKQCLYDFSKVPQMSCSKTCSWAGSSGCDQQDADVYCKLRTGNKLSKATSFKLGPPSNLGGFPCSDPKVYLMDDLRQGLGLLTEFGVLKPVYYQEIKIAETHGNAQVIQGSSLVCAP